MRRLGEIDTLRTFAVVSILLFHMSMYSKVFTLSNIWAIISPYLGIYGLGLFAFLSGYSLYLNNRSFVSINDIIKFYKKRIIRIYPLYLLSIISFFLGFQYYLHFISDNNSMHIDFKSWIIHIIGLQVLMAPRYVDPILTIWFIGLIFLFYSAFPFIIIFSNKSSHMMLFSSCIYLIIAYIHFLFNIIDDRLFIYYFPFISGILVGKINNFDNKSFYTSPKLLNKYSLIICILLLIPYIFRTHLPMSNSIISIIVYDCFIISSSLLSIDLLIESPIKNSHLQKCFYICATASFAVYLFHRPFFGLLQLILNYIDINDTYFDFIFVTFGFSSIFILCYYIQYANDLLIKNALLKINQRNDS